MFDPTLSTASIAALEAAINGALRYDPGTRLALTKLQGQVLAISVITPEFDLYLIPDEDSLRLQGHYEGEVTTRLRGHLPALSQLAIANSTSLSDSGVEVIGSTTLLSNLQRTLGSLEIDWEEALSQLLGDVLGHQAAQRIRQRVGWAGERLTSAQRLLSEYLTEELGSLPAAAELDDFYQQVDRLRMGTDRLGSRIEQLTRRIADRPQPSTPEKE